MSERDDIIEQAYHAPAVRPAHREAGLADQLPWFLGQPEMTIILVDEAPEGAVLGGPDYAPESGWFKPWAICPTCSATFIDWTDKALLIKIEAHCEEVGCALPEL